MFRLHSCAVFLFLCGLQAQGWTRPTPASEPSPRFAHAMAYDFARSQVVLFGGTNESWPLMADTWIWNGTTWTQQAPAASPPGRFGHAMAWDPARQTVLMFGGDMSPNLPGNPLDDTWEWNGATWTQLLPAHRPPAREMASLASDTRRGRVVLFGGWHTAGLGILGDTWEWDGVDWTQQAPARSPSARRWPAMAFDAQDGVTVLFGGLDASVTNVADTWIWNGVDWTQRPTPASPTVRSEHTMVATRGRAIVFGGNGGNLFSLRRGDTWEHDGGTWILTASTGPSARVRHGMVHDVARGNSVLFGGSVSGPSTFLALGETWVFTNNSASATTFGNGCAGSAGVPSLAVPAPPVLGSTLVVSITGMQPAGGAGFVALGFSSSSWLAASLPLSLATFGMPGCSVFVSVDATGMFSHGNGSAAWSLPIPLAPTLAGLRGYWQALVLDSGAGNPAGAVVTNAAATVMGL